MHRGYVKLWRKSLDSAVWKNPNLWRFWSWCLLKATHRETAEMVGYQCVQLEPGQLIFGRKVAAQETGLSERSIRTCLDALQKLGNLTIESTNKFSILTIVKWEDFQSNDQQTTSKTTSERPANDQLATTNKNINTEAQKKEEKRKPSVSCSEADAPNGTDRYSKSFEAFWKAYPSTRKGSKWKAYKSWQAIGRNRTATVPQLMAAIQAQVKAHHFENERGEDFTPNAVTWLNSRRWEDEITTTSPADNMPTWDEILGKEA